MSVSALRRPPWREEDRDALKVRQDDCGCETSDRVSVCPPSLPRARLEREDDHDAPLRPLPSPPSTFSTGTLVPSKKTYAVPAADEYDVRILRVSTVSSRSMSIIVSDLGPVRTAVMK